ncbi:STAS/SEC14 domain-containing protein [Flavobacterium sp. FBOR7N2.3]|uniref:STAS/SEC14 domain-containing protein n=1 Tax=Flavobacterium magnesitis TaxID=3138077 RepID=A0ABV4TP29_9FLAO
MIAILPNIPNNVAAFEASGTVTETDFENVVFPTVKQKVKVYKELNYLLYLNTGIEDFTFKAWLQDLLLGIKNLTKWNRCAIVTDNNKVQNFTEIFSVLMPGEFKSFPKDKLESAISWCANGEEKNI